MIEFTRAAAGSRNVLLLAAVPEGAEPYAPETRIFRYDHGAEGNRWFYDDLDFDTQSICLFDDRAAGMRYFCVLSSEGDVYHNRAGGTFRETIPGAGAAGLGRLLRIRQIGARLYATGNGGQIWRRGEDGAWLPLTEAALRVPARNLQALPALDDPDFLAAVTDPARNPFLEPIGFLAIDGLSEDAIYLAGLGGDLRFWDGWTLHQLPGITRNALTDMAVTPEGVWICGREGTVLHGSAEAGFSAAAERIDHRLYTSIQVFEGDVWLASNTGPSGVFRLAADAPRPERVVGPPRDTHTLTAAEGVLWAVGSRSISRLENGIWQPIPHPDL